MDYKKILEGVVNIINTAEKSDIGFTNICTYIGENCPELKESKDEKIRKFLIKWIQDNYYHGTTEIPTKTLIAWLEKQGEQKSAKTVKWSPQEESCICQLESLVKEQWRQAECVHNSVNVKKMQELMFFLKTLNPNKKPQRMISAEAKESLLYDKYEGLTDFERTLADICIGWMGEKLGWKQYIKNNADVLLKIAVEKFNSVQDVPFEQKPAWSEEDKKMMNSFLHKVEVCELLTNKENVWIINKLKSLKPQNTWKPSDEQLEALSAMTEYCDLATSFDVYMQEVVESLYQDLKKLKEE